MLITDTVNGVAGNITGFTTAGSALSTAIIGWVMFWRSTARLIPTEWKNKYVARFFKILNIICKCLGFDFPDIAQIDWKHWRIVTRTELTATKVVQAAVEPESVKADPPPPAAPTDIQS